MINASFYLNKQKINNSGQAPIYMLLTYNGQRIRKAIKQARIQPNSWNEQKSRVKAPGKNQPYNAHEEINARIASILESVHSINKLHLRYGTKLEKDFILKRIENPGLISLSQNSFFDVFDEYIHVGSSMKKERTIKGIRTVYNILKNYQEEKKLKIKFENIDLQFFESFRSYSFQEKGFSTNYFKKIVSDERTMEWIPIKLLASLTRPLRLH